MPAAVAVFATSKVSTEAVNNSVDAAVVNHPTPEMACPTLHWSIHGRPFSRCHLPQRLRVECEFNHHQWRQNYHQDRFAISLLKVERKNTSLAKSHTSVLFWAP